MQWEKEAQSIIENIPLPPLMADLARKDAERRARQKGLDEVTAAIARATEKGYLRIFGKEAVECMQALQRGAEIGLPDEFFEEDEGELFSIELCPVKYGACTAEKREMVRRILVPLRSTLHETNVTGIIMDRAKTPLMSHHKLRVSIIGCPNCCLSPYFSDIGIIALYRPEITDKACTQCRACVRCCSEEAITLREGKPLIDYGRCILCGGCVRECPEQVIACSASAYRVVLGGTGARHPRIARTAAAWADGEHVLEIVGDALARFKAAPDDGRERSFHDILNPISSSPEAS